MELAAETSLIDSLFDPVVAHWFREKFGEPTDPQRRGWPEIAAGRNTLIAAPTGSGKTLSAFMVCLDRLVRRWREGTLEDRTYVVYVSPLKALSNDINRNLEEPLAELAQRFATAGEGSLPVRVGVRTGDTPASQRAKMLRNPPHILVTTPESLYLLLTSAKSRELLRGVETIIVDEIHALVRDKRGSHLALTLERLAALCEEPPVRIGLSATQRPIENIARFLVGTERVNEAGEADCAIIDGGHARELDIAVEVPESELSAVCSNEQWAEIYTRLVELVAQHRSTLIFVNTRRLAERVSHHLREILGEAVVAAHHGSLSKEIRQSAEIRLKNGELRAIVATASLEMGIDIGYIDLVCQIGSTGSIANFLQRVGRAGHSLRKIPKGRLFPLTRDELLESFALVRAVRQGHLDAIVMPEQPLDILAQQIIAEVSCDEASEDDIYNLMRRAWPYRNLSREDHDAIVHLVSEGVARGSKRGAYLHRDAINSRLRARRGARLAALTSGGAIPEMALYRVVAEPDNTFVGTVDEDFAIESMQGDVFLLGNTSWRVLNVRGGEVRVRDAEGAPPSIPFWLGERPGRTPELSDELSRVRHDLAIPFTQTSTPTNGDSAALAPDWIERECGGSEWAAQQARAYVETQIAAVGMVPTCEQILFERFFDESGGMQLVIHAPLGARINRAWGLSLRKRFCRSFDFELQAAADDDGIVLSLGPQHSVPIEALFKMLNAENVKYLLEQALLAVPMFQVRWRWNLTRSLAVLRQQGGKRVPPHMLRFRSDDLLASVFPETVGCLENHHGDVEIPDHPLVRQTMHDCLTEAMDINALIEVMRRVRDGQITFVGRDTREPSPFSYELLNAAPYAFLDGAPLEERRVRAVQTRRTLSPDDMRDLAKLDSAAVSQVRSEAWPLVRSADELHDALTSLVTIDALDIKRSDPVGINTGDWQTWLAALARSKRATKVIAITPGGARSFWTTSENWPILRAAFSEATCDPPVVLPEKLEREVTSADATVALVKGRVEHTGPTTAAELAEYLGLDEGLVFASLEALEGRGSVLRGNFIESTVPVYTPSTDIPPVGWCDRRLLARIHRLTLTGLRQQIQAVEPRHYLHFLTKFHHLVPENHWGGAVGVREAIGQLQGFELPVGAWEHRILAPRISEYDPQWLDQLFMSGEAVWGRLNPPRRDEDERPSMAALTRTMPLSLLLREELSGMLTSEHEATSAPLRSTAEAALAALKAHGALFFGELKVISGVLPSQLEETLRELSAAGLVTSDTFAAVRKIVDERKSTGRARQKSRRPVHTSTTPVGRWSLFPGPLAAATRDAYLEAWARQLLKRWGVLFRDVLIREVNAPRWQDLLPVLRLLELRGEVRGGRFVSGVAGEQYALPSAVDALREARRELEDGQPQDWIVISAADPINLFGVITTGQRIPATHRNALVVRGGQIVAARQAGVAEFYDTFDEATQWTMRRAMMLGRKPVENLDAPPTSRRRLPRQV